LATPRGIVDVSDPLPSRIHLSSFKISGLLGGEDITLTFPDPLSPVGGPALLILSGRNGVGKTTILRMIGGMITLEFDTFRKVPFSSATLMLSNELSIVVLKRDDPRRPLEVKVGSRSAILNANRDPNDYTPSESLAVERLRAVAKPFLGRIKYELIELDRLKDSNQRVTSFNASTGKVVHSSDGIGEGLAEKVRNFLRDAQINHGRFFRAEDTSFLTRVLDRMKEGSIAPSKGELLERISFLRRKMSLALRMGLFVDLEQVKTLERIIEADTYSGNQHLILLETYIEVQEGRQRGQDLLVDRLTEFERTMNDFFIGKEVKIDRRYGIRITSGEHELSESELSSGERHFLSMMVVSLLCQRSGTIIAIDEPELSLHISWQRKMVKALARCAAGASPLFIFATHSLAISAEHADRVHRLSNVD
jgi:energy-coupling factor transporter ATP-binding protein EcfA2